jgi:hypothetical protein
MNTDSRLFLAVGFGVMLCAVGGVQAQQMVMSPSLTVPQQTAFTVDVGVLTAGLAVTGMTVHVTYDPQVVRLEGIDPGTWFTAQGEGGVAYFFHDFTDEVQAGELRFDGALLGDSANTSGQAAVCRFTALGPGESPLVFVEVDVRGVGNQNLGFGHSTGDLIRVETGQIYFSPSSNTPVTPNFTVDLAIAAAGYQVKGAEVEVTFNPELVALTDITPGDWVTGQGLQTYFYDYTTPGTGTVHFAMSFLDGSGTGSGVLAVCHFSALAVGLTPLDFVSVEVRDPDNQPHVFEHSTGDNIRIDPVISTTPATLGGVKASFR